RGRSVTERPEPPIAVPPGTAIRPELSGAGRLEGKPTREPSRFRAARDDRQTHGLWSLGEGSRRHRPEAKCLCALGSAGELKQSTSCTEDGGAAAGVEVGYRKVTAWP